MKHKSYLTTDKKPRIVCTLGSGAALGYAHIGVLRFLEEKGIEISGIAGTSMGAIIGGLYSYGYRTKDLEELVQRLNTREIAKFFFPTFPRGGIIDTDNIRKFLFSLIGDARIEELPTPFRCVATDIVTGSEVVFDSGPLIDGMIASMSIQGMFKPYNCKGFYLCDGGMCNPVPWNLGNELGNVNIIVNVLPVMGFTPEGVKAVHRISEISREPEKNRNSRFINAIRNGNIFETTRELARDLRHRKVTIQQSNTELFYGDREQTPSLMDVLMSWTFMTSVERRIPQKAPGVEQILIKPDMSDFKALNFRQGKKLIEIGYESAKAQEEIIEKYCLKF